MTVIYNILPTYSKLALESVLGTGMVVEADKLDEGVAGGGVDQEAFDTSPDWPRMKYM